ncbi:MAG: SGNH/GDSL hydrolase family protein [Ruminococcus sp.]|nr:SGNH/GDSL hydrolase family protein [Ruminococcus sp.]
MWKTKKTIAGLLAATVLLGATSVLQAVQVEPVSAASDPVKIIAMGDSITHGYINGDNGYRKYFCYGLQQNGITNFDMVGPNNNWTDSATYDWNGTTITYDPAHAGYSGYAIQKIGSRQGLQETIFDTTYVNGDVSGNMMEAYQPDVIMLQIGTNDVLDAQLTGIGDRLEELVDKLIPYVSGDGQVLYLASIPNIDAIKRYDWLGAYQWTYGVSYESDPEKFVATVQAAVDDYNTIVKNLVAKKQAEGAHIEFSDINSTIEISAGDLEDGVHPSEQGYAKMGQYWSNLLTETYFHGTVTPTTTPATTATTTTTTETTTTTTGTTTATDSTPAETTTSAQTTTTEPQINPSGDAAFTLTDVAFDTDIDLQPYSDITSIDVIFSAADGAFYNGSVTFDGWNEATNFTSTDLKNQMLTVTPSKEYGKMMVRKYFGDVTLEKVIVHTKGSAVSTTTTETAVITTEAKTTTETTTTTAPAVTTTVVTTVTEAVNGDVNGDGTADLTDLVMLQKYLVRKGMMTAEQSSRADLNADHVLNVVDAMLLRQLLLKQA